MLDLATLRKRLEAVAPDEGPQDANLAAVLVPLIENPEGWSLVFTRRTEELSMHSGEISFPGGRVDPGEHAREAALREAHEEMGIDPEKVDILGPLPATFTLASNYLIAPWVGVIPGTDFSPNPMEIAEVIMVPVETLLAQDVRREQRFIWEGFMRTNPAYDVGPNTIWGATARILTDLLDLLNGGDL